MGPQAARPIVMAWSGGKDSTLALEALLADPQWTPVALVTSVTQPYDRISMHGVRRTLLEQQAAALGLPLFVAELDAAADNARYEAAWAAALAAVRQALGPVADIAFGDLYLEDVRAHRDAQCRALGWTPHYPLWGLDTRALAEQFVREGHRAVLTCVDTTQLDAAFAGRPFDDALLRELPDTVDPCGEGGEFHTFVWHAPAFRAPIPVEHGERVRRDARFEYVDLLAASAATTPTPA